MPLVPIKLQPGVNLQETPLLNEGGWSQGENVRWKDGLAEKLGGYVKFSEVLLGAGVPIALQPWSSLADQAFLAISCSSRLDLFLGEVVYDITPNTVPFAIPISISTTAGSQVVIISNFGGAAVGEWFQIRNPISVGGLILFGPYEVMASTPTTTTMTAAVEASATVTGGAGRVFTTTAGSDVVVVTLDNHGLFTGQVTNVPDYIAFGGTAVLGNYVVTVIDADHYSIITNSATSSVSVSEEGGDLSITLFSFTGGAQVSMNVAAATMANWGEFLMWCPEGGPTFVWMPALGPTSQAQNITTAPQSSRFIFVASQQQQLFCCGTVNAMTGEVDPMLLAFSDAGDYTDFIPTVTNQAGSIRLTVGSKQVGGIALAGGNLVWTDQAVYSFQYLGPPFVWGDQPLAINCGLVGPHAFGTLGANVLWKSQNQFYVMVLGGAPQVMPCTVWDLVFKNQDPAQAAKVVCETNSFYNEASWEVFQLDGTVTRATVQIDSGFWTATTLIVNSTDPPQQAWTDQSVFGPPLSADNAGIIWQHEIGKDAGTNPLEWALKTGIIMIAEGDQVTFIRNIKPDFKFANPGYATPGVVEALIYLYDDPQDPPKVKGPFPITDKTRDIPGAKGRGRGVQFEFRGRDLGSWMRLGLIRYRGSPDGRR